MKALYNNKNTCNKLKVQELYYINNYRLKECDENNIKKSMNTK